MKTTSQHSQRARIVTPARGPQVLLYSRAPKPSKGDGPDEHGGRRTRGRSTNRHLKGDVVTLNFCPPGGTAG